MPFNIFYSAVFMICERGKPMGPIGVQELIIILIIVILLFGAKKIPELAKGLGTGLKEFKKASNDVDKQINVKDDATDEKKESKGS